MDKAKFFYLMILLLIIPLMYIISYKQDTYEHKPITQEGLEVTIYSKASCSFCTKAKILLENKGISYKEIDISSNKELHEQLNKQTKQSTVPYIFINGKFIGGYQELTQLTEVQK